MGKLRLLWIGLVVLSVGSVHAQPDVIVGDLHQVASFGTDADAEIYAYAVGTVSCNVGDEVLDWYASTVEHPVIGQNMFRLKDGRFSMIGRSWLKHGFTALQQDLCEPCTANPTGDQLGVGCSDPYSASLNGAQDGLENRSEVNASSGEFLYPPDLDPAIDDVIGRRLQVPVADIDPLENDGALYFVEGQYVALDDAEAGNQDNNASWREITVDDDTDFTIAVTGETVREEPAIYAWEESDDNVTLLSDDLDGDGVIYVAYTVTDNLDGTWSYEYAVQNLNSHRSVRSFSIPMPASVEVTEIGFHAPLWHSGEPYSNDAWTWENEGGTLTWECPTEAEDENANALRWGSLYNFYFVADAAPESATLTLEHFRTGIPATRTFDVEAPESTETVSEFAASPTTGGAPMAVEFVSLATGGITSWEWDFGDGNTSTEPNPVHFYLEEGLYTVSLTVDGVTGIVTETKDDFIDVGPPVNILGFGGEPIEAFLGQTSFVLPVMATNTDVINGFSFSIDFGPVEFLTPNADALDLVGTESEQAEFMAFEIVGDVLTVDVILDEAPFNSLALGSSLGEARELAKILCTVDGVFDDGDTREIVYTDPQYASFAFDYPVFPEAGTISFINQASFIRGDCNSSGGVSIVDALDLLQYLFAGGAVPACISACDHDDNGAPALLDALGILNYLFNGGAEPAAPFPDAGTDPTPDSLSCG